MDGFFDDLGGAVSDLFAAEGASQAGSAYGKAATIARANAGLSEQNVLLTARSGQIQQMQAQRSIVQTLGAEQASTAAAGFDTSSGSALDLMRSSVQQGALSKQLLANQTEITEQGFRQQELGYLQEAEAYTGQQQAAQTQAKGSAAGGILKTIGGIVGLGMSIFSDARMKENILFERTDNGFNIYSYNFKGSTERREGVLAQEVIAVRPDAVVMDTSGYYKVRYDLLNLETVDYGR